MCGICGIHYTDTQSIVQRDIIQKMTDILRHRGPDGEGVWINQNVAFGHRRLRIIDLSEKGHQPMCNEDGSIWITYNGEIYNFMHLRTDLEKRGHIFKSHTDTEVILHSYEEWGIDCINQFNGMFAFGLWDENIRKLFLVRDRIGIKPLFYYLDNDKLIFASEIKSILCHPGIDIQIEFEALHNFLSLNYMSAPLTMLKGIKQLSPGHYLTHKNGYSTICEYWDIDYTNYVNDKKDKEYIECFGALLRQSVKRRLISDVPFGAFLSGGLDSSSIVALMAEMIGQPVKTFSIGFSENTYNESEYANKVASHLGTKHYNQITPPNAMELLPRIVWHSEEPTADSSMLPVYLLSKLASNHVTMALSGDGADEILAGYETYQAYYLSCLYSKIPHNLRKMVVAFTKRLPVSNNKISFDFKVKRFVKSANLSHIESFFCYRNIFDEKEKLTLYNPELKDCFRNFNTVDIYDTYFKKCKDNNSLNKMLYTDTRFYLPNDMLVKVDRMSMANSLEVRVPFLDHELVEFMAIVPPHLKLNKYYKKKFILKRVMHKKLPPQIINRKKAGFNVPVGLWIKNELREFVLDILSNDRVRRIGLFNPVFVHHLIDDHLKERADNSHQIWGLIVFMTWWDLFLKKR